MRKKIEPYLYVAPLILLLLFVFGYPVAKMVEFSFKMVRGIDGPWVGWRNYELVLGQDLFWTSVGHNIQLLLAIPVLLVLSIFAAALLNEQPAGWKTMRSIVFLPYILAIPVVAVIAKQMLQLDGPVNETLRGAGLDGLALDWLGSPDVALFTLAGVIIWREAALGTILILARMMSIDESHTEAARLEGASWWQRLRHVQLPQSASVIEFVGVLGIITMVSAIFAYVYMIGGGRGGPGTSTMVVELYVFNALTRMSLPGIAATVCVMLLGLCLLIMVPYFMLRQRGDR
ncbi:carbohydrate ABC transporter permease [Frigidibacter sp. ROC022]|uniref:carbohydrate ABC transporter permease n=1 Tax=Frigidibacter sp. ROC022 TaxID=2971796 RepID=UPI00215AED99|nr:sugar ABC transporter permease [Frigidibacter sp. ROC022]MCR8724631.1 sugar ABC transporter permease [Frigidibacter sp. ROC022]